MPSWIQATPIWALANPDPYTPGPSSGGVQDASNASPIVITDAGHGLTTGAYVTISGVLGNTAANGSWTVKVTDKDHFTLNASTGNGAYTSGGQWTSTALPPGAIFNAEDHGSEPGGPCYAAFVANPWQAPPGGLGWVALDNAVLFTLGAWVPLPWVAPGTIVPWDETVIYQLGRFVTYSSTTYKAIYPSQYITPGTDPERWMVVTNLWPIGSYVSYLGTNYLAIKATGFVVPGTDSTTWAPLTLAPLSGAYVDPCYFMAINNTTQNPPTADWVAMRTLTPIPWVTTLLVKGTLVSYMGTNYLALVDSTSVTPGTDPTKWQAVTIGAAQVYGAWVPTFLPSGTKVRYLDGIFYVSLVNSTNVIPGTNPAVWQAHTFTPGEVLQVLDPLAYPTGTVVQVELPVYSFNACSGPGKLVSNAPKCLPGQFVYSLPPPAPADFQQYGSNIATGTLPIGNTYRWVITGLGGEGGSDPLESLPSAPLSLTTDADNTAMGLTWTPLPLGRYQGYVARGSIILSTSGYVVKGYRIYRSINSGPYQLLVTNPTTTPTPLFTYPSPTVSWIDDGSITPTNIQPPTVLPGGFTLIVPPLVTDIQVFVQGPGANGTAGNSLGAFDLTQWTNDPLYVQSLFSGSTGGNGGGSGGFAFQEFTVTPGQTSPVQVGYPGTNSTCMGLIGGAASGITGGSATGAIAIHGGNGGIGNSGEVTQAYYVHNPSVPVSPSDIFSYSAGNGGGGAQTATPLSTNGVNASYQFAPPSVLYTTSPDVYGLWWKNCGTWNGGQCLGLAGGQIIFCSGGNVGPGNGGGGGSGYNPMGGPDSVYYPDFPLPPGGAGGTGGPGSVVVVWTCGVKGVVSPAS